MKPVTLASLISYLKGKQLDAKIQDETNQAYAVWTVDQKEFTLFVRLMPGDTLLQLLAFFPLTVTPKAMGDTARLLHALNRELDLPGFGMEEGSSVVFFRLMAPIVDKTLSDELLEAYVNAIQVVCKTFFPSVLAVASGGMTFDELVAQAQEMAKKQK